MNGERRVDRQHRDLALGARGAASISAPISVDLPDAGRAGEADDRGLAGVRIDLAHELPARRVVVLDQRDRRAPAPACRRPGAARPRCRRRHWGRRHAIRLPRWTLSARMATAADQPGRCRRRVRGEPPPLHGGPLALLRFLRAHGMLNLELRAALAALGVAEAALARAPADRRAVLRRPGREARDRPRRAVYARALVVDRPRHARSARTRARCEIGAKTVLGQECTISAFQHVSIGRECIIADRVMLIDFDHGVVEVERPIRAAGHLQARRAGRQQRAGSATARASCAA